MVFHIALCVLPLAAFVVCCTTFNKEISALFAVAAVLVGFLQVVPIMALQLIVFPAFRGLGERVATRLLSALILNGLIEESVKFLCLLLLPLKNRSLSASAAAGAIAGLTLGALEAVMYFIVGFEGILLRLATAAVVHTLCATLSVLSVVSFRAGKKDPAPLVLAILIHGVYDFFAGFTVPFWFFSIAALLFAAVECRVRYTKLKSSLP
jgi:RsiW-degrading membrane proteinase PrsW (M82 family)